MSQPSYSFHQSHILLDMFGLRVAALHPTTAMRVCAQQGPSVFQRAAGTVAGIRKYSKQGYEKAVSLAVFVDVIRGSHIANRFA
jgi:hypothetical protein